MKRKMTLLKLQGLHLQLDRVSLESVYCRCYMRCLLVCLSGTEGNKLSTSVVLNSTCFNCLQ